MSCCTEGRIPVVKLGKHIRIDSADLDAYIKASRQEAWTGPAGLDQRRPA